MFVIRERLYAHPVYQYSKIVNPLVPFYLLIKLDLV